MRKPKFTREELNCLEAGHEVEKGKYTYRVYGKYVENSWHWVLQRAERTDRNWEDYLVI